MNAADDAEHRRVGAFVAVVGDGASAPTGSWGFTPLFALAVLLGAGNRRLRTMTDRDDQRSAEL
jgi:hypothetical protein